MLAVLSYSRSFVIVYLLKMDVNLRKRSKIVTLSEYSDKSQREIARICNVSQGTVSNILRLYKESGTLSPKRVGHCGRKKITSKRDDRYLIHQSKTNPRKTSDSLKQDLASHGAVVSSRTVRRRLLDAGRPARRPVKKQLLTCAMRKARLSWAKKYKTWTTNQWSKVSLLRIYCALVLSLPCCLLL